MLDTLFMQVLDMSKAAGIVILAVIAVRILLYKAPKIFSYLLWSVILFRLLCPVSIELPVSLLPEISSVSENYSLAEEQISIVGASEAAYQAVGDALNGGLGIQHIRTTQRTDNGMTEYVSADWWDIWILFGQYVWVLGMMIMVVRSLISYKKLQKNLAVKIHLRDNIYIADDISSPFVKGILKPVIYLPPGLKEEEQEYIILHEQCHIKRKDPLFKILAFLALCIHWFNPLVWIAFVLANKDMEMSCDESVLKKKGQEIRADYAASLLSLATGSRRIAGMPLAFGEGDTKSRIKNLAGWKKPVFWMSIMAGLVCVALVVCMVGNPVSKNDEISYSGVVQGEHVNEPVEMLPTSANLTGAFDSYLYVPLEGQTYRYERTDMNINSVTKGDLLYSFTEEADPENVDWKVYVLEEYPDKSAVLVIAGTDYKKVYEYSPSKRCAPDALDQTINAGYVVHVDGDVTSGQEIWEAFVDAAKEGEASSVQVAKYYTLEKENCGEEYYEAYKEDYPALYLLDLSFDGKGYTLKWNEGNKEYIRTYKYLMHYTSEASAAQATSDTYSRYVLVNDKNVTWEEILKGAFSSQFGDYIEHHIVYVDRQ